MTNNNPKIPPTIQNALERNYEWPPKPHAVWLPRYHWREVLIENYINARTMRVLMEQKMGESIQSMIGGDNSAENAHDRAFRSCTLAFYHFANTALNAARELSDNAVRSVIDDKHAKALYDYRKVNKKGAKNIADIRNQVVCHPENTKKAAFLSSWGVSCKVRARVRPITNEIGPSREFILDPKTDLLWLHSYLNELFPLLNKCFQIEEITDDDIANGQK